MGTIPPAQIGDDEAELKVLCDKLAGCLIGHHEHIICLAFMRGLASTLSCGDPKYRDVMTKRVADDLPSLVNSFLTGVPLSHSAFLEMLGNKPAQLQ